MYTPKLLLFCLCNICAGLIAAQISVSVFFHSGSATSGKQLQQIIDSTANWLRTQKVSSIQLNSYCDTDGDSVMNMRLSERRNAYVKNKLLQSGIPDSVFLTNINNGENQSINESGDQTVKQHNRRVDLQIQITGATVNNQVYSTVIDSMALAIVSAEIGQKVVIPNLEFYPGRHTLMPESQPVLQALVKVMQDNPGLYISLIGHICCMTDMQKQMGAYRDGFDADDGTNRLSLNRAIVVKSYLTDFGIASERILVKGKGGAEKLIDPEITEADRKRNRRVEVMIIAK